MDACDAIATQESTSEMSLNSSFSSHESGGDNSKNATRTEIVASDTAPSHQTETETKAEAGASEMEGEMKGKGDQTMDISSTTSNTISNEVGCYNYCTYMCGNTTIIDVE